LRRNVSAACIERPHRTTVPDSNTKTSPTSPAAAAESPVELEDDGDEEEEGDQRGSRMASPRRLTAPLRRPRAWRLRRSSGVLYEWAVVRAMTLPSGSPREPLRRGLDVAGCRPTGRSGASRGERGMGGGGRSPRLDFLALWR